MYVAIRRDLSVPQQVVQSCHAAIEASGTYHQTSIEHPSVVVIGIKSEQMLYKFKEWVEMNNLPFKEFREPDRNNELTSIAVYPVTEDKKQVFHKFQLLT